MTSVCCRLATRLKECIVLLEDPARMNPTRRMLVDDGRESLTDHAASHAAEKEPEVRAWECKLHGIVDADTVSHSGTASEFVHGLRGLGQCPGPIHALIRRDA